MSGKIVNLEDYKYKRIWLRTKFEVDAMSREYEHALAYGVCDVCGTSSDDVQFYETCGHDLSTFRCGRCFENESD